MNSGRTGNRISSKIRILKYKISQKSRVLKNKIMQEGFLYVVVKWLGRALKFIWSVLVFRKKKKKSIENPMKKIYQKWEEDWVADEPDKVKAKEDPFFLLFKFDYEYSCQKAFENKKKNFRMKFFCILPFLIVTVLYLGGVIAYNLNVFIEVKGNFGEFLKANNWSFSIYGTVFYAVAILLTYVVSKWLDVKQYQETWSRHSEHKYAVEMEMFKYIFCMDEYYFNDRKQKFVRNIMKTWDENQKKFIDNMKNEKDMGMNDLVERIKGKSS